MVKVNTKDNAKAKTKNNYFILLFVVSAVLLIVSIVARVYLANKGQVTEQKKQELVELGFYLFDQPRNLTPVSLSNLSGEEKSFVDHTAGWRIVNAGYLSCPDICPINLSLLNSVKKQWEDNAQARENHLPITVVHLTFDPERDRPELLQRYLDFINPSFYGLTGDVENIRQLLQHLNMVFIHEEPDEHGNYFITHSDSMALLNPQGQYVGLFKGPYQVDKMMQALQLIVK